MLNYDNKKNEAIITTDVGQHQMFTTQYIEIFVYG